jgi:ArsR family transcriptional regulator, arsenate/arsenite/antimonite-responsive transcriptional repressor
MTMVREAVFHDLPHLEFMAARASSSRGDSSPADSPDRRSDPSSTSFPSMPVDILTEASKPVNMTTVKLIQQIDEACCPPFLAEPLAEGDAERLAGALRVVADPARLRLLGLIASRPETEACVCELTGPLGLSQPTVSHHLKVLHEAGVLDREKRGRWVFYRLNPEPLGLLRRALGTGEPSAITLGA